PLARASAACVDASRPAEQAAAVRTTSIMYPAHPPLFCRHAIRTMVDPANLLAIVLMATVTYLARIGGYILLRNRSLGPRAMAVLEAAPGCVLLSVIAPVFVADRPADLIALACTVIAAMRLPLLPTVIIGMGSAALLRYLLP